MDEREIADRESFVHWVSTEWRPDDGAELLAKDWPRFAFAAWQAARRTTPDREAIEPTPMKEPDKFGWREPAWRMDAYYYGFSPTGIAIIDRILSSVACAGKSFHHTQDWTDHCSPYEHLRGETVVDWIQNAANDAAEFLKAAPTSDQGEKS